MKKTKDYGTSWRVLRPSSLTDQIFIKAKRIKTLEQKGHKKVDEDIDVEFQGIVNYCIIALIQLGMSDDEELELTADETENLYDEKAGKIRDVMQAKNHDYGEAWRDMRPSSFTDLILMKLMRIKQIENNRGQTLISEGIDSHYQDIVNYAIFALIKLEEQNEGIG